MTTATRTKAPSEHMASLIRGLTDAELAAKIREFQPSTDVTMLNWLLKEHYRRVRG